MMFADFVEVVGDFVESIMLCRDYYQENGLTPSDPLPADTPAVDRAQFDIEFVLTIMLNALFAQAARGTITAQVLEQWRSGAERASMSSILRPYLDFIEALFITNTLDAETAVRDQLLSRPWTITASVRIAIDTATRPVDLLLIHRLWADALPPLTSALFVFPDIEHLVTSSWQRFAEHSFLLRSPALTVPPLRQACASTSTGWHKIGEVLIAACDAVPATVPQEFRRRFSELE
jgi:hypothetical protein